MILLDFEGVIKGDAQQSGHEDWINLTSIQLGVARTITVSGSGKDRETSTPNFSEVACSKDADIASNELFAQSIYGKKICDKAIVHFIQTGGEGADQVYMEYELYEPIVSSYSISSGGERPMESFTVSFTKIVQKYTQFDAGGTQTQATDKGFDLKTGTPT
ncbi:Hcp family type VI secretion system effector [Thiorhodococcus minor]|uniref:Type VI secretion system tube protein Hcp n=1 Tax=Thiorhodococcus minor TaxID=57489 RepID=A0A6M0K5W4_9GAMM|nr:type VI secretion system tube protein Hcp [Thiorhodococcus minor]NEV63987.1 type VI secretion system tube protein Hcp [Thiorhodococcus minor]